MTENENPAARKPVDSDKLAWAVHNMIPAGATHFVVVLYKGNVYVAGDMERNDTVDACFGILRKAGLDMKVISRSDEEEQN